MFFVFVDKAKSKKNYSKDNLVFCYLKHFLGRDGLLHSNPLRFLKCRRIEDFKLRRREETTEFMHKKRHNLLVKAVELT